MRSERPRQIVHVRDCKVQAFGASWWNDVCSVAGEEQVAVSHGFSDEAAERGDGLFDRWAGHDLAANSGSEPGCQL